MALENRQRPPVVFISYSHDSAEHADRVLVMSNRLREDGIECILDQYENSPPEGWPRWMDKHIRDADFVLMICTEVYYKRVMGEEKLGTGQGVRWEGNLIYQHLYDADMKNTRFLPVLFADGQVSHIPAPLKGATRYSVDTPEGYELLYRRLTNQPRVRKPELGKLKKLPSVEYRERKQDFVWVVQGQWPGASLPRGGPKVTEPFAGREEELTELIAAMDGDKKVVAVVGMAGQGKSCLIGEWYKRGARPSQGVGLFWRKVYEAGYTFDRFLDDLHLYLVGEPIDRMQIKTIRDRATVAESLLGAKPCWIVLDGVERWLRRWVSDPDADVKNPTSDDRAGHEPALDEFMKGASFWENGSQLLLTTRAVPSVLDENLPLMIGHKHGHGKRLTDLKPEEAIGLLDDLDVKGAENDKREAVTAYGCHAYAVHVLGVLIRDLYGGDASRWREVNPLKEGKLAGLLERVIETCKEDVPLLGLVACSLGPAPVAMLIELAPQNETSVRKSLAGLKKWQMVEFDGSEADQHTIVRKFLTERLGRDGMVAAQTRIAAWWAQQETPANPTQIEEIRSLLRAVEHFAAAGDVNSAGLLFLRRVILRGRYTISAWLQVFGLLDEDIRITGLLIEAYEDVIQREGRRKLQRDLAACYSNRAIALQIQGRLVEAVADHGRAVDIARRLVDTENGHEIRTALVGYYSNRSIAFRIQGRRPEAMADLDQAIEIARRLVEREGQRQLRKDLMTCYNNRGNVFQTWGRLSEAIADYGRAIEIAEELAGEDGQTDLREQLTMFYSNRGTVLTDQGHTREAITDFDRAIRITEELVKREDRRELRNNLADCYTNRGTALADQGRTLEAIADHGRAIGMYEELIEQEARRELRDHLAKCYTNRGIALADQGYSSEAIDDLSLAIEITKELVEREGRRELYNDLAKYYNNRGIALANQTRLPEAIADFARAIEIREELVEREGRHEFRSDLESSLFNRALAMSKPGQWQQARADIEKGIVLLQTLVREGQRQVLGELLKTMSFCCRYAKELDDQAKIVQWVNEAMRWLLEEVEQNRTTERLLKAAAGLAERVRSNQELFLRQGLDELLWRRFLSSLGPAGGDLPPV